MRKQLKNYIKENINIGGTLYTERDILQFRKMWSRIEKDCKQIIDEYKHTDRFMLRGLRGKNDFSVITPRSDRKPKDTNPMLHNAFDNAFQKLHGWKPRSEGVFVTGKHDTADSYGDVFIVLPIGRYKYLWSDDIEDLYSKTSDDYMSAIEPDNSTLREWEREWEDEYSEGGSGEWLYDGGSTSESNIDNAIQSVIDELYDNYEEDFDGEDDDKVTKDEFYKDNYKEVKHDMEWEPEISLESYIDNQRENWEPDESGLYDYAYDVIKRGKYSDRNLKDALTSGSEIMLKCEKYHIIGDEWSDLLRMFIQEDDPDQLTFDFSK